MPAGVLKVGAGVVGFYVVESKLDDTKMSRSYSSTALSSEYNVHDHYQSVINQYN